MLQSKAKRQIMTSEFKGKLTHAILNDCLNRKQRAFPNRNVEDINKSKKTAYNRNLKTILKYKCKRYFKTTEM